MGPRQARSDEPTGEIDRDDGSPEGPLERADPADLAEDRTEWAEERTDWAHARTLLAKERTFSAWLRTGLATVIAGFAVARFLPGDEGDLLLVRIVSIGLVVVGGALLVLGYWSYRQGMRELEAEGVRGVPRLVLVTIILALVAATILGGLLIL